MREACTLDLPFGQCHLTFLPLSNFRREDLRMKHALTRLQNFYRDVRTVGNNSVWPPRGLEGDQGAHLSVSLPRKVFPPAAFQGLQPQGSSGPQSSSAEVQAAEQHSLSSSGPLQLMVPGGDSPNEVSWFSGSLQIKTPKPVTAAAPRPPLIQLPVLPEEGASSSVTLPHNNKTVEMVRTAGSFASLVSPGAAGGLASFPSLLHGADPSEVLGAARGLGRTEALEFVSSFIHQHGADAIAPSPRAVDSPKAFVQRSGFADYANMGFMTSPKPSLALVEPRDEYEEVLRIAERLPALRSFTPP